MKKIHPAILHVSICAAFLFFPYLVGPGGTFFHFPDFNHGPERLLLGIYLLLLAFFYLNFYVFIPRVYFKKKTIAYYSILFVALLLFLLVSKLLDGPMEAFMYHDNQVPMDCPDRMVHAPGEMPGGMHPVGPPPVLVFIIGTIVSLLLSIRKRLETAENEKVQAELSLLKAQINPHFLFNTLNNIYSLALTNDERTADSVIQLSEIMRYIMENSNENIISLTLEISYLNNYISLQKSRLGNTAKIRYSVNGDLNGKNIAPLILISFIENAFKHGVNPDENSEIDLQISITDTELRLRVSNNKVSTVQTEHGLGMRNTIDRLELLYPQKHQLSITETKESYTVELMLQL